MRPRIVLTIGLTVAAIFLIVAPALAEGPPTFCNTKSWRVDVVFNDVVNCDYPTGMNGGDDLVQDSNGNCTGVQYSITGRKAIAHSAVLAYNPSGPYDAFDEYGLPLAGPSNSNSVNERCVGDVTTSTGIGSCHEQAIRYNPEGDATGPFWFVVAGVREFTTTTVALKGNKVERCEILGVGDEMTLDEFPSGCVPSCGNFDEDQQILRSEIIQFDDCHVQFDFNTFTGEIIGYDLAQVCVPTTTGDPDDDDCCDLSRGCDGGLGDPDCCAWDPVNLEEVDQCDAFEVPGGVGALELLVDLNGESAAKHLTDSISFGIGNFGDGYISTGDDSCTCRMFAGRVFCWGSPCPSYSSR